MLFYNNLILFIVILMIILLIRFYIRKKNMPGELIARAVKSENSGYFEAAVISYESALVKVKKNKFKDNGLENRIIEKIKTLYTVIEYHKNFHFSK